MTRRERKICDKKIQKRNPKHIRRTPKKGGGDRAISDSNIPYDTVYHEDMSKAEIKKHLADIDENLKRNAILQKEAVERVNAEQLHQNKKEENDEIYNKKNAPQYDSLKEKRFQHRFNSVFTLVRYILDNIIGVIKEVINKLWSFLGNAIGIVVKIICVETVVSIIAYILVVVLIASYIFGYAINMPIASMQAPSLSLPNAGSNIFKGAEEKLKFVQSVDYLTQITNFFKNIPLYFSNAFITLKNLFSKLNRVSGNDNTPMFSKDRVINNTGRWDNIYNMELGKLVSNFENIEDKGHIYSVSKPSSLEMHLSATANKDLEMLPSSLRQTIQKDKEKVAFKWNLDRQAEATGLIAYKMNCNPVDAKDQSVQLFTEAQKPNTCTILETPFISFSDTTSNKPKYYDKEDRRYDKSENLAGIE